MHTYEYGSINREIAKRLNRTHLNLSKKYASCKCCGHKYLITFRDKRGNIKSAVQQRYTNVSSTNFMLKLVCASLKNV